MEHVYVKNEKRLYSFAPSSVISMDNLQPIPIEYKSDEMRVRVVEKPIFYAGIAITNLCNLTCKHCPVSTTNHSDCRNEWDIDSFETLISGLESKGLTRVSITGGEPFLHSDIIGIFKILHKHGIESKINSNGILAKPEIVSELADLGLVEIDVSINDPVDDSESYESFNNYAQDRINAIANLTTSVGGKLTVTASSVLTKRLLGKLSETSDKLYSAGAKRWRLREMLPNLDHMPPKELIPTLDEINLELKKYIDLSKPLITYGYLIDALLGAQVCRRCKNLEKYYIYVSYDGQCWWMAGLAGAPLGNIKDIGASVISNNLELYTKYVDIPERCITCPARFVCAISPFLETVKI